MHTTYQISEYGSFISGKVLSGYTSLPEKTFDQLEKFILSNRNRETDALDLMGLSARKGIGKIITAKNYIGLISMNDGTTIEILPKIYSETGENETGAKRIVIEMLKTLRNSPYKSLQTSQVDLDRMSVFEIFIRMFIEEIFRIVKRGLKSDYVQIESNETVYKGKMIFSEQIRHNSAHKERSFVMYDAYSINRAENRLIKLTLDYLYRATASSRNKANLKTLLGFFSEVDCSKDYKQDFGKCVSNRNMSDYETALLWCKVFLEGRSFTAFSGSEVALALLFPMETLFESYIAAWFRRLLKASEYKVSAQDKRYHLFDEPKRFLMKPDIVITRKMDGAIFILDTKWKLLSDAKANYGISQTDMYQMYAYQKKYGAECVTLLYPMTNQVPLEKQISYKSEDGTKVRVGFVDLFHVRESLSNLMCMQGGEID
jgi:5-methylcytosine-specific restriction enzyme subunit McrC